MKSGVSERRAAPPTQAREEIARPSAAGGEPAEIRILAGRSAGYTDRDGLSWDGDRFFEGGEAVATRSDDVYTRGFDRNLFSGMREGRFEYAIPAKDGSYELEFDLRRDLIRRKQSPRRGRRIENVLPSR